MGIKETYNVFLLDVRRFSIACVMSCVLIELKKRRRTRRRRKRRRKRRRRRRRKKKKKKKKKKKSKSCDICHNQHTFQQTGACYITCVNSARQGQPRARQYVNDDVPNTHSKPAAYL